MRYLLLLLLLTGCGDNPTIQVFGKYFPQSESPTATTQPTDVLGPTIPAVIETEPEFWNVETIGGATAISGAIIGWLIRHFIKKKGKINA